MPGRTWLFDLTKPLAPRILASFEDVGGYSHPHNFIRLADGNVLATFQYQEGTVGGHAARQRSPRKVSGQATGGLVVMDETGG